MATFAAVIDLGRARAGVLALLLLLLAACRGQDLDVAMERPAGAVTAVTATAPATDATPRITLTTADVAPTAPAPPEPAPQPTQSGMAAPPAGLLLRVPGQGVVQVQEDGGLAQLLDEEIGAQPGLRVAPGGRYGAYLDAEQRLWLLDTAAGEAQRTAAGYDLSYLLLWGDDQTLLAGVWLDPAEKEGPNNGHVALIDRVSGTVTIVDEKNLAVDRPALLPGSERVALGGLISAAGRIYDPAEGVQRFDREDFSAQNEMLRGPLFNPAWAADGTKIAWLATVGERNALQVFDLQAKTAVQLLDWDPARMGGMVPSAVWSPDGAWLALNVWANDAAGSGLWLVPAAGGEALLVDGLGRDAQWHGRGRLLFNHENGPHVYDVETGQKLLLDVPQGSGIVGQ